MSTHVLITCSTRGIGYGLAEEFLKKGCTVTIHGRLSVLPLTILLSSNNRALMNLTTPTHKLFVARAEADENGAAGAPAIFVNATAGDFASKPSGTVDVLDPSFLNPTTEIEKAVSIIANSKVNGIAFSFMGGSAAGKTFTADFFTWANRCCFKDRLFPLAGESGNFAQGIFVHCR